MKIHFNYLSVKFNYRNLPNNVHEILSEFMKNGLKDRLREEPNTIRS